MVFRVLKGNNNGAGITVGSFEVVSLPELNIADTVAKIDTGAYTGALHCEAIEEISEDDKQKLRFTLTEDHSPHTAEHYAKTKVRSSNGQQETRYIIETDVVIQGKTYPLKIGLTNRSEMKHDMLIGRRFLRENSMLVDVRKNQSYDTDGMNEE